MRTIGANIRFYGKKRGYTQEKLAEQEDINEKLIGFKSVEGVPPSVYRKQW